MANRHFHFFINPAAGRLKQPTTLAQVQKAIHARIPEADISLIDPTTNTFRQSLGECIKNSTIPVVVGGDGSISRMCTALLELTPPSKKPEMAVVPLGSGNDAARTLGLSLTVDKALSNLSGTVTSRSIDLLELRADGSTLGHGLTLATFGFPIDVIHATEALGWLGALKYAVGTLMALTRPATPPPTVTFKDCDVTLNKGIPRLVGLANGAYTGGGMKMVPSADIGDGQADAIVLQPTGALRLIWLLINVFAGTHVYDQKVSIRPCNQMQATIDQPTTMVLDGELFTVQGDVTVAVRPQAIQLFG